MATAGRRYWLKKLKKIREIKVKSFRKFPLENIRLLKFQNVHFWHFSRAKSTILQNFRIGQTLKVQSQIFYINWKLSFRICHFSTFRSSEFWLLMIFCTFWRLKITKLKNSDLLKWYIWHYLKPQNWFHTKFEW